MEKFNYCPMCGAAWDAWNDGATKCWNCGWEQEDITSGTSEVLPDKCEDHPKYHGIGVPVAECLTCWKMHKKLVDAKIKELSPI